MEKRRVVITGLGAVTPLGHTARETWEAAKAGVCGIAPITLYDASNMKAKLAGEVKGFDPANYMEKREARKVDRFAQFALAAAKADARMTKIALRQAAARTLPPASAARKKLGFPVPVRDWLRQEPYTSRVRAAFVEELSDILMYYIDLTLCFGVSPEEFEAAGAA